MDIPKHTGPRQFNQWIVVATSRFNPFRLGWFTVAVSCLNPGEVIVRAFIFMWTASDP